MFEYNIDGVKIPFDEKWSRIAVSLSGGADSALLTFLLCKIASEINPKLSIHIVSHVRCWKTKPWQSYDSRVVYEWLYKKFNYFNWYRHINFIAPELEYENTGPNLVDEYNKNVSGDNIQIRAYSEYVCHQNKIQAYYNAVTRNPKNVNFNGMQERDVDPNEHNQHLRIMKHMDGYAIHPFRFIEKDWILKQYKNLDIMDLFKLTRSCEAKFEDINYKNYRQGDYVPVCNKCFWCLEREWAIEQSK
jgi:hypothetical protein